MAPHAGADRPRVAEGSTRARRRASSPMNEGGRRSHRGRSRAYRASGGTGARTYRGHEGSPCRRQLGASRGSRCSTFSVLRSRQDVPTRDERARSRRPCAALRRSRAYLGIPSSTPTTGRGSRPKEHAAGLRRTIDETRAVRSDPSASNGAEGMTPPLTGSTRTATRSLSLTLRMGTARRSSSRGDSG